MIRKNSSLAVAGLAILATVSQTLAGGRPVECLEPYRTAPVYDTVYENVQVHPGYSREEVSPPIYGTKTRQVLTRPGRIAYRTSPAIYAYETEQVLVEPARTVKRRIGAVHETRYRKVRVAGGGYSWEWRIIDGRRVLCKIRHKARYENVAYRVEVSPARYVHETLPARYEYRQRKVLVTPESTESYVLQPEYETIREQVVIQPEHRRVIETPPSYETVARRVVVSEGSAGWKRVRIRNHCAH